MIKQSFPFNELLARKEFENANTCKHKYFFNKQIKRRDFCLFQCTQNETTSYFHKNFPFLSNTQILQKQTFSKEIFYFIKHSKLWKNLILRSINSKNYLK